MLQTVTVFKKVREEFTHKCRENKLVLSHAEHKCRSQRKGEGGAGGGGGGPGRLGRSTKAS